jgi:hypothetical protein
MQRQDVQSHRYVHLLKMPRRAIKTIATRSYNSPFCCRIFHASGAYLGMSSLTRRTYSLFSVQPLHCSFHSERMFLRSLTLSFWKFKLAKSALFSTTHNTTSYHYLNLFHFLDNTHFLKWQIAILVVQSFFELKYIYFSYHSGDRRFGSPSDKACSKPFQLAYPSSQA